MATPNLYAHSPSPGYIRWSAFNIRYGGQDYAIAGDSTNHKYVWWDYSSPASLKTGNSLPEDLTSDDLLLFLNKDGTPINVHASTVIDGDIISNGSIVGDKIAGNTITAGKIHANALDGKTITGSTIQTASGNENLIRIDGSNNALVAYGDGGEEVFVVDGEEGAIRVASGKTEIDRNGVRVFDGSHWMGPNTTRVEIGRKNYLAGADGASIAFVGPWTGSGEPDDDASRYKSEIWHGDLGTLFIESERGMGHPTLVVNGAARFGREVFSAYKSASQSTPTGAYTALSWPNVVRQATNVIVRATGDSTAIKLHQPGVYLVSTSVEWAARNSGNRYMRIMLNGSIVKRVGPAEGAGVLQLAGTALVHTSNYDSTLEIEAYHSSGSNLLVNGDTNRGTTLDIVYLGT